MTDDPVARWVAAPFPPASRNDELDELHKELIAIDAWVAECVIDYRDAHVWAPAVPDVFGALDRVAAGLRAVNAESDGDPEVVRACLDYIELTASAYREFLSWESGRETRR